MPEMITRQSYEGWAERGGKTLQERAREKAVSILNLHKAPLLRECVHEEVLQLVTAREAEAQ